MAKPPAERTKSDPPLVLRAPGALRSDTPRSDTIRSETPKNRAKMQPGAIETLNMGLMLLALGIAAVAPLEVFLLSYAVLGPLHYATEISWLGDRQFFALRRGDWIPLAACAVLITLGNPGILGSAATERLNAIAPGGVGLADWFAATYVDVTFVAFGAALVFAFTKAWAARSAWLAIVALAAVLFHFGSRPDEAGLYFKLFGVYLPTLVHVFLFTGAFILAGALKRRSRAGYLSFAVFLICGGLALWLPNVAGNWPTGAAAQFWQVFRDLALFSLGDLMATPVERLVGTNVFTSPLVLRLVRFFAFAYTYHYLNWFSKTSIIQWHAVSRPRLLFVGGVWLASVGLYAMNYELGLRWLFLLSLGHVLLEFPLNHRSFLDIASELRRRFAGE